ncbi:hypothetical protein HPIN_03045 [Helicobacter pylori India7]|uniref:Uncharacterized protein n=1 Tax=Helicobacter pylori (strain India7) TaxID=907238 RepID=E8QFT7_HELP7|nr:hypothetical protein HPIN_03045 [Helicobacter pylori India7]
MLILIYPQTPLRALKNEVFKFRASHCYHHLTNIIKVVLNPKILKYPFE